MQNIDLSFIQEILPQLMAVMPLLIGIVVAAFVLSFVSGRGLQLLADRTSLTDHDVAPFRRIVKWLIRGVALVLMLSVLGFNLGGLWAVFSTVLAMIAIGFVAVWSVLSNVSCTVIMLIARPFNIGDEIEVAGEPICGRVVDLNFVYTTLRDADGRLIQIPNNLFFQKVMKRRVNPVPVTLAAQLSSRQRAELDVMASIRPAGGRMVGGG
ncbi:mechanosensitive ion channel protein MscS [Nibricoccus aquaticus]|uniref:Mechanosensitive ion channel protein MscS n=1 Tax=Nibricoccus aquaticus TaxID=2576891 RepID=A0A290QFA2_9BACT|nr:mechanosensitive ion channel domain-containing protein [Nibricoccus aquaticus]ATC64956.1 mechanosensitive ion channel protein MscS [Nibricoccus aquaticus]